MQLGKKAVKAKTEEETIKKAANEGQEKIRGKG